MVVTSEAVILMEMLYWSREERLWRSWHA